MLGGGSWQLHMEIKFIPEKLNEFEMDQIESYMA